MIGMQKVFTLKTIDDVIAYYRGQSKYYDKCIKENEKDLKACCDSPDVADALGKKDVGKCIWLIDGGAFDRGMSTMTNEMVQILERIKQGDIIINKEKANEDEF